MSLHDAATNLSKGKYKLAGGDGASYGPKFGPIYAEEVREIRIAGDRRFLLLRLETPMKEMNAEITHLLVTPRYTGETIDDIREGKCTVGLSLVRPGKLDELRDGVSDAAFEYWSVGTIECRP